MLVIVCMIYYLYYLMLFFVHGYIPKDMIKSVIDPIIKSKIKSSNDKSIYRPVTIATVISKVFERVLFIRMEPYLYSSDNQFGFKRGHGTDMCIFTLKQVLQYYRPFSFECSMCTENSQF